MISIQHADPEHLEQAFSRYLNCPCTFFAAADDDDELMDAWQNAVTEGLNGGQFIPVIIVLSAQLFENVVMNACPDHEGNIFEFDADAVSDFRARLMAEQCSGGAEILESMTAALHENNAGMDGFDNVINGSGGVVEPHLEFQSYWDFESSMTLPVVLAQIPVQKAEDVFAFLPFSGGFTTPDVPTVRAVASHWFLLYGARPAVVSQDGVEFSLSTPVPAESAGDLALNQYAFCPSLIEASDGVTTIASCAESLKKSTVWSFAWD